MSAVDVADETLMPKAQYLDINAPFEQLYRNCDSTWAAASEEELEAGLAWWRTMIEEGKAEAFLASREKLRLDEG